jgi:hypothetical protein
MNLVGSAKGLSLMIGVRQEFASSLERDYRRHQWPSAKSSPSRSSWRRWKSCASSPRCRPLRRIAPRRRRLLAANSNRSPRLIATKYYFVVVFCAVNFILFARRRADRCRPKSIRRCPTSVVRRACRIVTNQFDDGSRWSQLAPTNRL